MLVARALDGDTTAFGALFRRHGPGVHAFAQRRTRSVHTADDIVSAAFEKGWYGLDRLGVSGGGRFRPWIFRIAANEMASMMRSNSRRRDREHLAAVRGDLTTEVPRAAGDDDSTVSDLLGSRRVGSSGSTEDVLDALTRLSERHQEVITLRYLADLTPAETAVALGVTRGNVAVLLHRATRALSREVEAS